MFRVCSKWWRNSKPAFIKTVQVFNAASLGDFEAESKLCWKGLPQQYLTFTLPLLVLKPVLQWKKNVKYLKNEILNFACSVLKKIWIIDKINFGSWKSIFQICSIFDLWEMTPDSSHLSRFLKHFVKKKSPISVI